MRKNILIIGGSSGIGLELARHYVAAGHRVGITGRDNPHLSGSQFFHLAITASPSALASDIDALVSAFPDVQTLVYAAGFFQCGTIETLNDEALFAMTHVGLVAPMLLTARLKPLAPTPLKLMLITSSAQYTPRAQAPAYAASKAGLAMLGASLALDPRIGKVLVVAPSRMKTPFGDDSGEDTTAMLEPGWVAQQIVELSSGVFKYRYAQLLRNPARVKVVETLNNDFQAIP